MKKIITFFVLTLLLQSCKIFNASHKKSEFEYFKVEIVQDGNVIEKKNGIVTLEKKPFTYQLTFFKVDGIDVSNSWGKYFYDYPDNKNIYKCSDDSFLKDCRFVAVKSIGEDKFNKNRDICVGDESYQSHWFYKSSKNWHRLDDGVKVVNGVTYAQVSVDNIFDVDKRDSRDFTEEEYKYPIENINQNIYVVFAASHYESGMEYPKELQREKFILVFE